jgi:hypothetical protein
VHLSFTPLRIEGLKRFSVETCFIFSSFPYCNLNKHLHILQWLLGSSFAFRVGGLPRFGFASFFGVFLEDMLIQ